ncbi:MAG: hypothetical protein Q4G65_11985 [bacterium]|nr:hypothetical protein [bacterium]
MSECNRERFDAFWQEFTKTWGIIGEEETVTLRRDGSSYKLRCVYNEGTVLVAMISPWIKEWDYAQVYRGMFGWGEVGKGFNAKKTRTQVLKLLLDEIVRRNGWLKANPAAVAQRDRELAEAPATGRALWFEKYRWVRNKMADVGEGDMRLYVPGINRLFSVPIHCEWALNDQD